MLSFMQIQAMFLILSNDLSYLDHAMMEMLSFEISHFMVYSLVLYCKYSFSEQA
jgi:uncharacterized membrane protein YwaF